MSQKRSGKGYSAIDNFVEMQRLMLLYVEDEPPLKDREVVKRALLLTLLNPNSNEIVRAMLTTMRIGSHGEPIEHIDQRIKNPSVLPTRNQVSMPRHQLVKSFKETQRGTAQVWWDSIVDQRRWFRSAVESIIEKPRVARQKLTPFINGTINEIAVFSQLTWDGRSASTDTYYLCVPIDAVLAYALMLMLDTNRELSKALNVCKYEYCDRIFLSFPPPGGGPRTKYCKPDHKLDADKLTGAERTARWRRKKSFQAKKSKRGKKA